MTDGMNIAARFASGREVALAAPRPAIAADQQFARALALLNVIAALGVAWGLSQPGDLRAAWFASLAPTCLFTAYVARARRPWLVRLYAFALSAGVGELAVDAWLVRVTGTLAYAPGDAFVWASPVYMPFAWGGVLITIWAVGRWLERRASAWATALAVAALAGLYVPLFELAAGRAGWWRYRGATMLAGNVPLYIFAGEALVGPFVLWLGTRAVRGGSVPRAAAIGAALGLGVGVAYAVPMGLEACLAAAGAR